MLWNIRLPGASPKRRWTSAITFTTVLRCSPPKGSHPLSKSPIISNMKGPAWLSPFCPVALAGAAFQLRPSQMKPCGSIVMCWAMSDHPLVWVW